MHIPQAIYTSVRGPSTSGYQLAAVSTGISAPLARELSRWGPGHDALQRSGIGVQSINFHSLAETTWCVSRSQEIGAEYSDRRGLRLSTQMLVLDQEAFAPFEFNPMAVVAAWRKSACFENQDPEFSETLPVVDLEPADAEFESEIIPDDDALSHKARECIGRGQPLFILHTGDPTLLFDDLFAKLSVDQRMRASFTTALRPSPRRAFLFHAIPHAAPNRRSLLASLGAQLFDADVITTRVS